MAKAPKAPGQNGSITVETFVSRVTPIVAATGDGYWRGNVASNLVAPVAALAGEASARALLEHVEPRYQAQALARIAESLARHGKPDDATRVLAEAESVLEAHPRDGEEGTHVWHALACARDALGDAGGCDRALAESEACAKRERSNPTQPWPHLSVACAVTRRFDTLLRLLQRHAQLAGLSFDDERAARVAVASMVQRGDVETFERYFEWLRPGNGYVLTQGIKSGVEGALRAARGEALAQIVSRFAELSYYGSAGGADIARSIAIAGDVALAIRCAEIVRERAPEMRRELADVFSDLGMRDESERLHARCSGARITHPVRTFELFAPAVRAVHRRSPDDARALLTAVEEQARALDALNAAKDLAVVGVAWLAVDTAHADVVLRDAAERALTLPKTVSTYERGQLPKSLGVWAADADAWAPALMLLRKSSSKSTRSDIARSLARCYARAGDLEGAWMVISMMPPDTLHTAMCACDVLCERASMPRPYSNYA